MPVGTIIYLLPDAIPPAGFTRIGSKVEAIQGDSGGPSSIRVDVYRKDVEVTSCHAITAVKGGFIDTPGILTACPTGATQFCETVPIVATDSAQAGRACSACFGAGNCTDQFGLFWFGVDPNDATVATSFFNGQAANGNCIGRPGDITNGWNCPQSRWAP